MNEVPKAEWERLLELARVEVELTRQSLPADLLPVAQEAPVSFESRPSPTLIKEGYDEDVLGLFEGNSLRVATHEAVPIPLRIILFLGNLWEFAGGDEADFREEVRITYLHELGHYLGL